MSVYRALVELEQLVLMALMVLLVNVHLEGLENIVKEVSNAI